MRRFMVFRHGDVPVPATMWRWLTEADRRHASARGLSPLQVGRLIAIDIMKGGPAGYSVQDHDEFLNDELKTAWPTDR